MTTIHSELIRSYTEYELKKLSPYSANGKRKQEVIYKNGLKIKEIDSLGNIKIISDFDSAGNRYNIRTYSNDTLIGKSYKKYITPNLLSEEINISYEKGRNDTFYHIINNYPQNLDYPIKFKKITKKSESVDSSDCLITKINNLQIISCIYKKDSINYISGTKTKFNHKGQILEEDTFYTNELNYSSKSIDNETNFPTYFKYDSRGLLREKITTNQDKTTNSSVYFHNNQGILYRVIKTSPNSNNIEFDYEIEPINK